jgi:hypothetical protein
MPREFKSEETRQRFLEGQRKASVLGGYAPKKYTPEGLKGLSEGGKKGGKNRWKNKVSIVAKEKTEYIV